MVDKLRVCIEERLLLFTLCFILQTLSRILSSLNSVRRKASSIKGYEPFTLGTLYCNANEKTRKRLQNKTSLLSWVELYILRSFSFPYQSNAPKRLYFYTKRTTEFVPIEQ